MRDPGQLRTLVGCVRDHGSDQGIVGPSFQVSNAQWAELTVAIQPELWRLRLDVPDRSSRRMQHARVFESFQKKRVSFVKYGLLSKTYHPV